MNDKSTTQKEIETLFSGTTITINDEKLTIKSFSWGEVIQITEPMKTIADYIVNNIESFNSILESFKKNKLKGLIALNSKLDAKTIVNLMNALTQILSVTTNKPRDYINKLMPDEIITLVSTVYKVNEDFFKQRMANKLNLPVAKKK